ncbi:transport permease protein [Patiriisocius marinistellae]|uniref:Transport permease protein n=1 Tax=Patiriisocius marinistellae TaxID=2494560 RepID=A0A5J4G2B4_9FLAO|nr:ABC transporter permease [Patiriisocius marinistellae]GEQ86816.1 transport permease protein [Patiriisocius marinistellae]
MSVEKDEWLYEISAKKKLIDLNLKELWQYRDLLFLFVKRDIVTVYKQTILGPLWYLIQPLFTSVIFTLVFNNLGNIKTGGIPPFLFNLAGITAWNYFKVCLTETSSTFTKNQNIFGKVYFPRAIMPISVTFSNLLKFGIQLFIFIIFYFYFITWGGYDLTPNSKLVLFPIYVLMMAMLGLGAGMLISSWTTKYKDLNVVVSFAVQLLMYISAVPFPMSEIIEKKPEYSWLLEFNPLAQIVEGFRHITMDSGYFTWWGFLYTLGVSCILFFFGLIVFNRTEKNFIDTV